MESKPFITPEFTFWDGLNGIIIAAFILGGLGIIAGLAIRLNAKKNSRKLDMSFFLVMLGSVTALLATAFANVGTVILVKDAYRAHVTVFEDNLAKDGFKVVSGDPDLHLNAHSSLLLSYNDKNFDCTLFSPNDENSTVVFSCGESKLSLAQIKEG